MQNLPEYFETLSAATPTPGGGSVAGLAGALGAALGQMVAGLTEKRRQYIDVRDEVKEIKERADQLQAELRQTIEDDAYVYQRVITVLSYRTEQNDKSVIQAIEDALIGAAQVPLNVMKLSVEVARLGKRLTEIGLDHAVADAAAAVIMSRAAAHISILNIHANLKEVNNKKLSTSWKNQAGRILAEIDTLAAETFEIAKNRIESPTGKEGRRRKRKRDG